MELVQLVFYLSALWYGINSAIVVAHCYHVHNKTRLPASIRFVWHLSLFVISLVYVMLVLRVAINHPTLFLNMTYGGVMRQLDLDAVRLTSVLHFNWGDPIAMSAILTWATKKGVPPLAIVLSIPAFILFAPSGMVVLFVATLLLSPHRFQLDLLA